ncbi:MAG: hypothetical protein WAT79_08340 [Saprospiraceae bacterium]
MASTNKLYQTSVTTTAKIIIQPNVGDQYTMSQLLVHNPTASLETFKIHINETQIFEQAIPPKNTFAINGPWTLAYGDVVHCESTNDALVFISFGILITA